MNLTPDDERILAELELEHPEMAAMVRRIMDWPESYLRWLDGALEGLSAGVQPDEFEAHLRAYRREHPPRPAVVEETHRYFQARHAQRGDTHEQA